MQYKMNIRHSRTVFTISNHGTKKDQPNLCNILHYFITEYIHSNMYGSYYLCTICVIQLQCQQTEEKITETQMTTNRNMAVFKQKNPSIILQFDFKYLTHVKSCDAQQTTAGHYLHCLPADVANARTGPQYDRRSQAG